MISADELASRCANGQVTMSQQTARRLVQQQLSLCNCATVCCKSKLQTNCRELQYSKWCSRKALEVTTTTTISFVRHTTPPTARQKQASSKVRNNCHELAPTRACLFAFDILLFRRPSAPLATAHLSLCTRLSNDCSRSQALNSTRCKHTE